MYQSRIHNSGCLLVHATPKVLESAQIHPESEGHLASTSTSTSTSSSSSSSWRYVALAPFMKIQSSVFGHVEWNTNEASVQGRSHTKASALGLNKMRKATPSILHAELSLASVELHSPKYIHCFNDFVCLSNAFVVDCMPSRF